MKSEEKVSVAQSRLTLQPHGLQPTRLLGPRASPGKNTGVGSHSLLQGIFPTQDQSEISLQADSLPSESPGKPNNEVNPNENSLRGK